MEGERVRARDLRPSSTGGADAARRPALKCAQPAEAAAIQTTIVDQQLVDAALTCGDATRAGFNAYRTAFGAGVAHDATTHC